MPMETYRLANYAVPVHCYICGGDNAFDSELCRHCQAPMAIAHHLLQQKTEPRLIATIGAAGSGKTVYLGMLLDMLSGDDGELQALARGAFSITLQQTTIAALERCQFPVKTPSEPDCWSWAHCQIRTKRRRHPLEVIMPDMAGDAVAEEIDHPGAFPVINQFLRKAMGLLILIDSAQIEEGSKYQDYFVMKILSYMSELRTGRRWRRKPLPVALVFTKADQCPDCFDDPDNYAEKRTPGLWQHCQRRFPKHGFFAASVAGACGLRDEFGEGKVLFPLRIEPRGVVEPFAWMMDRVG
jgi:hypothetical protein